MKPLTDREVALFCVAFDRKLGDGSLPTEAAERATLAVEQLRMIANDRTLSDAARFMVSQIVDPPPALFCWDGAKPQFKRVGPVEICERCQQSPADHFGTRPRSG